MPIQTLNFFLLFLKKQNDCGDHFVLFEEKWNCFFFNFLGIFASLLYAISTVLVH